MSVVKWDKEIVSGTPCFEGTRVPVDSLFDHLDHGYTIEGFVEVFSTVTLEQAKAALEEARAALLGPHMARDRAAHRAMKRQRYDDPRFDPRPDPPPAEEVVAAYHRSLEQEAKADRGAEGKNRSAADSEAA